MTRILHVADLHLGKKLHGRPLDEEFETFCDWLVRTVRDERVNAVLVSGDVYDRAVPPREMVGLLNRTLKEVTKQAIVVMTSGNHDDDARLGFAADLLTERLHIRTDGRKSGIPVVVGAEGGTPVHVYPIPFLEPRLYCRLFAPNEGRNDDGELDPALYLEPRSHENVLNAALELVRKDVEARKARGDEGPTVVMAHTFVTNAQASESNRPLTVGTVDSVSASVFRLGAESGPGPVDYVALGHLHQPQSLGGGDLPPIRYCGSPIAFSFSETKKKTAVLLDFKDDAMEVGELELPVVHPIEKISGTLDELTDGRYDHLRDAYLHITVTDPKRPAHLKARIDKAFAYPMHLEIEAESKALTPQAVKVAGLAPEAVFEAFAKEVSGAGLSEAEREAFARIWNRTIREGENR